LDWITLKKKKNVTHRNLPFPSEKHLSYMDS
jgi:hypothetical protein